MGREYEFVFKETKLAIAQVMTKPSSTLATPKEEPQENTLIDTEDAPNVQDENMMIGGATITIATSEDLFTTTIEDPSTKK